MPLSIALNRRDPIKGIGLFGDPSKRIGLKPRGLILGVGIAGLIDRTRTQGCRRRRLPLGVFEGRLYHHRDLTVKRTPAPFASLCFVRAGE